MREEPVSCDSRVWRTLLTIFACRETRATRLIELDLLVRSAASLPPRRATIEAISLVTRWCYQRPWSRCMWPEGITAREDFDSGLLALALCDLIAGDEPQRRTDQRWAYQRRGYDSLRQLIRKRSTVPRLFSAARVAMDLGEQSVSVAMLRQAQKRLDGDHTGTFAPWEEFFLPPHHRHDDLDPGSMPRSAILQIMLQEPLLERFAYSIYFVAGQMAPMLRSIASNPLRSPAMSRRLAAARKIIEF